MPKSEKITVLKCLLFLHCGDKTVCSVLSPTVCNWYRCCEAVYFQAVQNGLWFLENGDITPHLLEYCELVMQWQCTCLSCR